MQYHLVQLQNVKSNTITVHIYEYNSTILPFLADAKAKPLQPLKMLAHTGAFLYLTATASTKLSYNVVKQ